jgi:hypothetical protein
MDKVGRYGCSQLPSVAGEPPHSSPPGHRVITWAAPPPASLSTSQSHPRPLDPLSPSTPLRTLKLKRHAADKYSCTERSFSDLFLAIVGNSATRRPSASFRRGPRNERPAGVTALRLRSLIRTAIIRFADWSAGLGFAVGTGELS